MLHGTWNLCSSGTEPRTPALVGGFFTTEPSGKPYLLNSYNNPLGRNYEKAVAPHSSNLAWKIPWMEEPGRLQSMGVLRVGYD